MFRNIGDNKVGVSDGVQKIYPVRTPLNSREIAQKVTKSHKCAKLTTNTVAKSCIPKSGERSETNPCLGRSFNKLSTSLEHLYQYKYEAQGPEAMLKTGDIG